MININKVERQGKQVESVGTCPKCGDVAEFKGERHCNVDSHIKGWGFKQYIGICMGCNTEYTVTENTK